MNTSPPPCRTVARTETIDFNWEIDGFEAIRKLARLKALPSKDRLFSPEFGNRDAGHWKVALFPYGDREAGKHVSMYLFGDKKHRRVASFSMVVLDSDLNEIPDSFLAEDPTYFTVENNSWGWHEFLSADNDDELRPYIFDDVLRVHISVKAYMGVMDDETPARVVFNIVHTKCDAGHGADTASSAYNDCIADYIPKPPATSGGARNLPSSGAPDVCLSHAPISSGVSNSCKECAKRPAAATPQKSPSSQWSLQGRSLQSDVATFALDPRVQDITLVCDGKDFKANRFLLAARSEVFQAMLYGGFAEAFQTRITISDLSAECVEDFLRFIATDTAAALENSCDGHRSGSTSHGKVLRLMHLLAAAQKYLILELEAQCIQALAMCISAATVLDILEWSEALACSSLVDACHFYLRNSREIEHIVNEIRKRRYVPNFMQLDHTKPPPANMHLDSGEDGSRPTAEPTTTASTTTPSPATATTSIPPPPTTTPSPTTTTSSTIPPSSPTAPRACRSASSCSKLPLAIL